MKARKKFTRESKISIIRKLENGKRDLIVIGINQLWAADITYIRLVREFIYLAVIIEYSAGKLDGN